MRSFEMYEPKTTAEAVALLAESHGAPDGASYRYMGDEHGAIDFKIPGDGLGLGDKVEWLVPHCDPNVNLYNDYHVVRGDTLVDIWPVAARGNS